MERHQEFLPASGQPDLAKTGLAPDLSESVPQGPSPLTSLPRPRNRGQNSNRVVSKNASDFEQGYTANVAPRQRRPLNNRIPVPPLLGLDSDSRRVPPDKRPPMTHGNTHDSSKPGTLAAGNNRVRSNPYQQGPNKDKPPIIRSFAVGGQSTLSRQSKVSNMAKHFERISRENERTTRRYAVIRGKRARPVASVRAKVEILESFRDAVEDEESESSSESSETDADGEGEDGASIPTPKSDSMDSTTSRPETLVSNPLPSSARPHNSNAPTDMEVDVGERTSILRVLSGLWPGQAPQSKFSSESDVEDPMADTEHIFRDASMVVRTDEPTSVIALALKYAAFSPLSTVTDPIAVPPCIARC